MRAHCHLSYLHRSDVCSIGFKQQSAIPFLARLVRPAVGIFTTTICDLPQIADASTDLLANAPQIKVTINRDQAGRFGISPQVIDDTLNDAYGQRQIAQYFTQLNTYSIIEEITPELQKSLNSLDRIYIKSPLTGGSVPLSALVDFDTSKGR
jgi:multidrug efflux pump subunit AcrB